MTDDEFGRFAAALRAKSATVRQLQEALAEAQAATAALAAREAALRAQADGLEASLTADEVQLGMPVGKAPTTAARVRAGCNGAASAPTFRVPAGYYPPA
jgi:long-subunit fatty acid transport protein